MANLKRGSIKVQGFTDPEMDFQLLRQLGATAYGASSVGECFAAVNDIHDNEPKDWVHVFTRLANHQLQDGLARLAKQHKVSAYGQLIKACNSFRAAEYYSPVITPEHKQLGFKARSSFQQAMRCVDHHFESLMLELDGEMLPAYAFFPKKGKRNHKTLIIVSGFDGTLEEEFLMRGMAGLERGYNIVVFAGPGQMDTWRVNETSCFKPDYERAIQVLMDRLITLKEVNPEKIALCGISFGGYFATRAACHVHPLGALIANSPIIDLYAYMTAFAGIDPLRDIPETDDFGVKDLPDIPEDMMPRQVKFQCEMLMQRYGRETFRKTFEYIARFKVDEAALKQIQCPALALIGSGEGEEPQRQSQAFIKQVQGSSYCFDDESGASTHCQVGNVMFANAVMYDWLDETLN
ncbi:dipeptidyl aminopeptidase/acylaminoacyl peptidase [Legionella rubrilucens]|uniref:Dipeptidyl aminopeptidase/acylaminoacyl peptidase n=1 Tax=Legionella rubrilucens TaxID=458 RepID=A0A0W0XMS0_9GAMM|nr:alpha/beta hydrolase [Legionella rubrilucens]KTD45715.1 dipeptidyl aminopeptidase/acylaminoacyl peptidase [Legionella rubrilucens]